MRPKSTSDINPLVPVLPLSGALLLPRTQRPLVIFEPRYIALIDAALASNRLVGLVQPESDAEESPLDPQAPLRAIGCLGYITQFEELPDERYLIVLEGVCRFSIASEQDLKKPYREIFVGLKEFASDFDNSLGEDQVDRAQFLSVMREYAEFADIEFDWAGIKEISTSDLVNTCCLLSPYGAAEKQALLEAVSLGQRAETLIALAQLEMSYTRSGTNLQ